MTDTFTIPAISNSLSFAHPPGAAKWFGRPKALAFTSEGIRRVLEDLSSRCFVVRDENGAIGVASSMGTDNPAELARMELIATLPAFQPEQLGDPAFRETYGLKYNYMAGAMANGIASAELVIAMGKAGMLAAFGAGGMVPERIEAGIATIQAALPQGPFAVNLIHSPSEEALERQGVELFLRKGVRVIEASAFLALTSHVVRYRVAGLRQNADGSVYIGHRIIAKVSRLEVAAQFMQPAPESFLKQLLEAGMISAEQARLAARVPMADDITVEADSGGHTDNRSLVCLLPAMVTLRDQMQQQFNYPQPVRVGAAGGIGTPEAVFGAFSMGAAFVVTGSINQSCRESGSSDHVRKVLAQADMTDTIMAPAADMLEMGVKLQVLKKGTLFGLRAQKLLDLYLAHDDWAEIPEKDRQHLEKNLFRGPFDQIWQHCVEFFQQRDPEQLLRAENNPKRKMALVFRWYLGLSSAWANRGEPGRELDYQIWCGPSMGAFNQWVKGSRLENWEHRRVADLGLQLLYGAAYLSRLQYLVLHGVLADAYLKRVQVRHAEK
jgi:trans-AT polyketide synthase/acyltransferase/oxidoreductase domain-containing protein